MPPDMAPSPTRRLTDALLSAADITAGHRVLDVGCGVGHPALDIVERHGAAVTGISTSPVGVRAAQARAVERGLGPDEVRFDVASATDNGRLSASFDRVVSLEAAHLMDDHAALFRECARVLVPGGRLALCDVTLVTDLQGQVAEVEGYRAMGFGSGAAERIRVAAHAPMHRAFGSNRLTEATVYRDEAHRAGFVDVEIENLSAPTRPTLAHWADNAEHNAAAIAGALGDRYLEDFFLALLHMSATWGRVGGYVLMTATKPEGRDMVPPP